MIPTSSVHRLVSVATARMRGAATLPRHAGACCSQLAGAGREPVSQVAVGVAQPAGLGGEAEQGLMTARVTSSASLSLGAMPTFWPPWRQLRCVLQQLVGLHLPCGREGVQVGVHEASHEVDVG
jgi:hypothetical protein